MVRSHFARLIALSLVLALSSTQPGRSDDQKPLKPASPGPGAVFPLKRQSSATQDRTCSVYALGELADDPNFGKWIADTIPTVIHPGSWSKAGVSYYAPGRILVVNHTPPVQAKVAAFLQDLKKALPAQREQTAARSGKATDPQVVPAKYATPSLIKTTDAAPSAKSTYPVPAAAVQPKHLFHLIIRYEGDGLTDANVGALVNGIYAKTTGQEATEDKAKSGPAASAAQLSQLFQFIVRYEGEGLIDSNVAEVLKTLYGQKAMTEGSKTDPAAGTYSNASSSQPSLDVIKGVLGTGVGAYPPNGPCASPPRTPPELLPAPRNVPAPQAPQPNRAPQPVAS